MYNCKIVSLIAFLFKQRKEEKKREKKDFFNNENASSRREFCPSLFSLSFCALDKREERKGY